MNTIGNYAPDFEIPGIDKEVYHLGSYRRRFKAIAVIFMDKTGETSQYLGRLKQIQSDFAEQKFTIMGIDSSYSQKPIAESIEAMEQYAQVQELNFPYLRDSNQDVAKGFKVKVTPTVYLLDSDGVICYQGLIDDGAKSAAEAKNHYLRDSVAAMLGGHMIERDYIAPVGIDLTWRPK